ncbi:hypothetical protein BDV12DRAFT_172392 [Aspergillus spectabilis]
MLNCQGEEPYLPTASESAEISNILRQLSLPEELTQPILSMPMKDVNDGCWLHMIHFILRTRAS